MTFDAALRSILRQDPDIIMVGEMRDAETAEIAIRAAITGHLVLSTLHTNDAASTVTPSCRYGSRGVYGCDLSNRYRCSASYKSTLSSLQKTKNVNSG